jgi:hypothetical protein
MVFLAAQALNFTDEAETLVNRQCFPDRIVLSAHADGELLPWNVELVDISVSEAAVTMGPLQR